MAPSGGAPGGRGPHACQARECVWHPTVGGVYHLAADGCCSWAEFATVILELSGRPSPDRPGGPRWPIRVASSPAVLGPLQREGELAGGDASTLARGHQGLPVPTLHLRHASL